MRKHINNLWIFCEEYWECQKSDFLTSKDHRNIATKTFIAYVLNTHFGYSLEMASTEAGISRSKLMTAKKDGLPTITLFMYQDWSKELCNLRKPPKEPISFF